MSKQVVTCACGHSWEYSAAQPLPADLTRVCPVCTAATQATLEHPSRNPRPQPITATYGLAPGQVLPGFEILEEINRGGMGVIYKARQQGLNRLVALKVISPERLGNPDAMHRFRREVQAAALLNHPNIVMVYHTDLDAPAPYLVMEYVAGIDLHRLVKQAGPLHMIEACLYMQQAAHGLQHAFEQGLVHRDIKPANLMVTPSPLLGSPAMSGRGPRVKILDMGLARVVSAEEGGEAHNLTQFGEFLGTPDFIAPEQAEDPRNANVHSDLYSLGGTLYFLLVGEPPFAGGNLVQKLRRQLTEPPPSVRTRRPDVPAALDTVVRKLLSVAPEARYRTPAEVIEALHAILHRPQTGLAKQAPIRPTPPAAPRTAPASPASASKIGQVQAHVGGVRSLSLSSDGQWLLSGGMDETLRLWETARLRETQCIRDEVGQVEAVCLAPGSKWAASSSVQLFKGDTAVQLWDLAGGSEQGRLHGHEDTIRCLAVSADGQRVAAGGDDRTIRVWSLDQPDSPRLCLKGHAAEVRSVVFLPGEALLSGAGDGQIRLWNLQSGAAKGNLNGQVGKITAVAFGGATKRIAIAGEGLRIRQANGTFVKLNGHQGLVLCVAFAANGELLVSGGSDGTVRLWGASDGAEVCCFQGHKDMVRTITVSPDSTTAYSGSADGTIRRWLLSS